MKCLAIVGVVMTLCAGASIATGQGLPVGQWKVEAKTASGTPCKGRMVCVEQPGGEPVESWGYIDWSTSPERPASVDFFRAVRGTDGALVIEGVQSVCSTGVHPTSPAILRGLMDQESGTIEGTGWSTAIAGALEGTWRATRTSAEAGADAGRQFEAWSQRTPERLMFEVNSSGHARAGKLISNRAPDGLLADMINDPGHSKWKGILVMRRALESLRSEQAELARGFTEDVRNVQEDLLAMTVRIVRDALTGADTDIFEQVSPMFKRGGGVDKAIDRQIKVAAMSIVGLVGEGEIRRRVKGYYASKQVVEDPTFKHALSLRARLDGGEAYLSIENQTGLDLSNCVLMIEMDKDPAAIVAMVRRGGGDNPLLPMIGGLLGLDPLVMVKSALLLQLGGVYEIVPCGNTAFCGSLRSKASVELSVNTAASFMMFTKSGTVWLGSDQGVFEIPMDLKKLRAPLEANAKKNAAKPPMPRTPSTPRNPRR